MKSSLKMIPAVLALSLVGTLGSSAEPSAVAPAISTRVSSPVQVAQLLPTIRRCRKCYHNILTSRRQCRRIC